MSMHTDTDSPDFLPSARKGKGVRRLNRLPLMIVAGLVLLAVFGIAYTMLQRQADISSDTGAEPDTVVVAGTVLPPIQPDLEPDPDPLPMLRESPPPRHPGPSGQHSGGELSPDLQQRLRLIERVEEKRLIAQEAALDAEPVVPSFSRGNRSSSNPSLNPAALAAAGLPQMPQMPEMPQMDLAALAGLGGMDGMGSSDDLLGGGLMGLGGGGDPNRQAEKRAFLADVPDDQVYLRHTRLPALAPTELKAGTVIPGVMIGGVNSDLPGQIIGQVRQNIYDTASGLHLLVPAGARLVGTYDSSVTMGQRRVLVAWNRIIFPDGSSVSLDKMPGADVSGYAGFKDKVNNHYWRIFGNAFMLSLFSAGIQLSQPDPQQGFYHDTPQTLAAEIGRQLGQVGTELTRRNLNIQPTLEIRPGYQFNIMVTKDMILPPWQGHPLAVGQR